MRPLDNRIKSVDAAGPLRGRVRPGDTLLSVNGKLILDVLDYKYYCYDRDLLMEFRTAEGKIRLVRVRKPDMFWFRVQFGFHGLHGVNLVMTIAPEYR